VPADAIDAYPTTLPGLVSSHLLDGCGHWLQQERPQEVNHLLTTWLAALPQPAPRRQLARNS
jgi:pimeloyl-ACP methyl ester carboxylesterase